MSPSLVFRIDDSSQPGEARRAAVALAQRLGFDETARGRVALVVTEAATNLIKHAGGGELVLRALEGEPGAVEVLAIDRGPGMADVGACLVDGYSTAGSSGNGLGAIARLADAFDVFSTAGAGTVVLARLHARPAAGDAQDDGLGAVSAPYPGEIECGDAWAADELDGRRRLIVADGLGHGPLAAEAARAAVRSFEQSPPDDGPADVLRAAHAALKPTRGAAVAVAEVDPARAAVQFAGVGNIAGAVVEPEGAVRSLMSHNGIVGHEARKIQEFEVPCPPGSLLVLHSDGLSTQCRVERVPGLAARHPALIAGVLFRDFRRQRDDATVVVARAGGGRP